MGDKKKRKTRRPQQPTASAKDGSRGAGVAAPQPVIAPARGPRWLQYGLTVVAAIYLASLFLNGAGSRLPRQHLPPSMLYFVQSTCLFPRASQMAIDYRLEVWICEDRRFEELDPRAHFPIHADDKESRFHRLAHFYRQNRTVMRAFERYMVQRENQPGQEPRIGGVRVSSLRIPFPAPGEPVQRWSRPPMEEHPPELVKRWYYTPASRHRAFCAGQEPPDDAPRRAPRADRRKPQRAPAEEAP